MNTEDALEVLEDSLGVIGVIWQSDPSSDQIEDLWLNMSGERSLVVHSVSHDGENGLLFCKKALSPQDQTAWCAAYAADNEDDEDSDD